MFEYIRGILQYKGTDFCVIDVGGVGFRIYTSYLTASALGQTGQTVTLYTYMNVKEDEISYSALPPGKSSPLSRC